MPRIKEADSIKGAFVYIKARQNLVAYRKYLLDNEPTTEVQAAPFQHEWSDILLYGQHHVAFEAFRESGKSQIVLRSYPLYACTYPDPTRGYIVLIKNNATLASNKLLDIEKEYMDNPTVSANLIKINEQSGKVFDLDVEDQSGRQHNVRMEAYGKGAAIRGLSKKDKRPDICIIDDPQDKSDSESDTILKKDWEWFLSDVMFLGKKTRIFLIGNNLGAKCIIEQVIEHSSTMIPKFDSKRIPALDLMGKPTWAQMYSADHLLKERDSFRSMGQVDIWYRERMCEAISEETQKFKREDVQIYGDLRKTEDLAKECNVYFRTDLAVSDKKSADFSVIAIVGINEKNQWFILDVIYGRYDPNVYMDLLFQAVVRWKPMNVGLPGVAYEAAFELFLRKEMQRRNIFFHTFKQKQEKQKEVRIMALQPRFKAKTIFVPEDAPWLSEFYGELLLFPKAKHDDIIDALASMEQESEAPYGAQQSNAPRSGRTDAKLI